MQKKPLDAETESLLSLLTTQEQIRNNRVAGTRTVLVVLSARGMVFDTESLRQKILLTYPHAAVFFRTTYGRPIGVPAPKQVDLLIDFTGPGQRQYLFYAKTLRRMARVAVGRNSGLFRKRIYDRVWDEKTRLNQLSRDLLERERQVQREVLALAGVAIAQTGDLTQDRSKTIALELPPMSRL